MALQPIIHCVVDQEPTGFHQSDIDGATVTFAVNLSFECQSDDPDEDGAKAKFDKFLQCVQSVRFRAFSVAATDQALTPVNPDPADATVSASPYDDPASLMKWLGGFESANGSRLKWYWTTPAPAKKAATGVTTIDADQAAATHRLRAAHSWNAPVGHRFALTHIVRIARATIEAAPKGKRFVILPYFGDPVAEAPNFVAFMPPLPDPGPPPPPPLPPDDEIALDYSYDLRGDFGTAVCRTNRIGGDLTKMPFQPSEVDKDGYFAVDPDADKIRRLLAWLEERAASLMTANFGLLPYGTSDDEIKAFEEAFGIRKLESQTQPDGKILYPWVETATQWYAVARLISALDNLIIAFLKPGLSGEPVGEGELVAPFVSFLAAEIDKALPEPKPDDEPQLIDPSHLAVALRDVLRRSPLMGNAIDDVPFIKALRHVYGLSAPPAELDESSLVTALLEAFPIGTKVVEQHATYLNSLVGTSGPIISRRLMDLEQTLHDEAGAEAAIMRLIETVDGFSDLLANAITAGLSAADKGRYLALVKGAVDAAWADYRNQLKSNFNGAEAIRRAVGHTFVHDLLAYVEAHPPEHKPRKLFNYLLKLVRTCSFYEARFFEKPKPIPGFGTTLLRPDLSRLRAGTLFPFRLQLRKTFWNAIAPLNALNDPYARFIPDNAPHPIPIQVAASIDGSKIDSFGKHFNGIAVAIQRADLGTSADKWAYANLADLGWTYDKPDEPGTDAKGAIHPMLPAASDGRSPMFIEYQGFPFADRALEARIVDNDAQQRAELQRPFYRHDPHTASDFSLLPRIAYGRSFKTFSFVTSNAGTLPLALQKAPETPWLPAFAPEAPLSPGLVGTADYQRRTAISQMSLTEKPVKQQPLRLGVGIDGVKPLAEDYPRIALMAGIDDQLSEESAVRDIMREADGAGTMIASRDFEWRLSNLEFAGAPDQLLLRFFERAANHPGDMGDARFTINDKTVDDFAKLSEIAIGIKFTETAKKGIYERRLYARCGKKILESEKALSPGSDGIAGWLRLELKAAAGKAAAISFANPGSQKSDNVNDPLLLLAPNEKDWISGLNVGVDITVSTPRVGYLDFERWFANADSWAEMFANPEDPGTKSAGEFAAALLVAYVMRHLDLALATAVDRLPDPAVEKVRIELTPHDVLAPTKPELGDIIGQTHDLKYILRKFARGFSKDVVNDMLKKEKIWNPVPDDPHPPKRPDPIPWTPLRLRKYVFDPLDELFKFTIRIQPGLALSLKPKNTALSKPPFTATVPEGVVARLSIDSLVPLRHFKGIATHPAVFDSGLMQYALRKLKSDDLAFPAAAVRVETMYDGIKEIAESNPKKVNQLAIDLAGTMISAAGVEKSRLYEIKTAAGPRNDDDRRRWRLLHEIDVTTQRWRTTGRPIYHHVDPRQYRLGIAATAAEPIPSPALPLDLARDSKGELARFESEAFFDRADIDAQTITKALEPLPARTTLQQVNWNPESATYFRHRFRLRSRYAGALKFRDKGEVIAWPDKDPETAGQVWSPAQAWTMRVAMLADLANVRMTRPQLRALIPLTTVPGGDASFRPAPPVAAILQEPPFSRSGLADRIAAEVKTGFSYGFSFDDSVHSDDTHHLEILDSRKEGGPDPRLSYRPLDKDTALGLMLRSEGPMGLTFDDIDGPAPAYPNTMFSLSPATLKGNKTIEQSFEEMFVGAAMRRYIDPAWTTESSRTATTLDGERCWWIAPVKAGDLPDQLLTFEVPGIAEPFRLLDLRKTDASVDVFASRLAIDGIGASETNVEGDGVKILSVDRVHVHDLAILHQPVAPGRYSASIFITANSANTERGEINAPLMVASFEWSPPTKDEYGRPKPVAATISATEAMSAFRTLASAPTFVRWTRTGRDVDFLHLPAIRTEKGNESWRVERRHVRDLVGSLEADRFSFKLKGAEESIWLCPSTFGNPYPIHVHRHLAIINSYFLKELGQPAELFCRTALAQQKSMPVSSYGSLDFNKNPPDQTARVVEFETPAQILCGKNVSSPTKYKEAYFDLRSTGFNGSDPGSIQLYFRIVGPPLHQRSFTGLSITLRPGEYGTAAKPVRLKWTNSQQSFVVGVYLTLQQKGKASDSQKTIVTARLLRSDGQLVVVEDALESPPRIIDHGFFVSIEATAPTGHEFWTDVSMLHSSGEANQTGFDFRWLFSTADEAEEPAVSVSPARLNMMREAQARVIAVSLPIPIQKL